MYAMDRISPSGYRPQQKVASSQEAQPRKARGKPLSRLQCAWKCFRGPLGKAVNLQWHAGAPRDCLLPAAHLGDVRWQHPGGDMAQLMQQSGPQLRLCVDHLCGQLHTCRVPASRAAKLLNIPQPTGRIAPCTCTGARLAISCWGPREAGHLQPAEHLGQDVRAERRLDPVPWLGTREGCGLPPEVGRASCGLQMRAPGDSQVSRQALVKHRGIEPAYP